MTDSEYLAQRRWRQRKTSSTVMWDDPIESRYNLHEEWAVAIQRARDEAECRAAWVQFAAARFALAQSGSSACEPFLFVAHEAAKEADILLVSYCARFGLEVPHRAGG